MLVILCDKTDHRSSFSMTGRNIPSDTMALVEGPSPPVFEQIFRNARFAQGGNALFEGKVRGNPKPQVVWTRKGLQMKGEALNPVRNHFYLLTIF